MRERISKCTSELLTGSESMLWIGTFHQIAFRLLRMVSLFGSNDDILTIIL
jgi:superfamily I DNA/RNA helicase